eukprot:TRINITY_DN2803_c0_g1_i20.p1 TRINITY_DN2803_c0_g1~~TRINITY_DN2803_c0_g1_i20.p1  ORF type:complete len:119 (-),score=19.52 TRINITY_DN2803_c0_g1_i20:140-496(-)
MFQINYWNVRSLVSKSKQSSTHQFGYSLKPITQPNPRRKTPFSNTYSSKPQLQREIKERAYISSKTPQPQPLSLQSTSKPFWKEVTTHYKASSGIGDWNYLPTELVRDELELLYDVKS